MSLSRLSVEIERRRRDEELGKRRGRGKGRREEEGGGEKRDAGKDWEKLCQLFIFDPFMVALVEHFRFY